MSDDLEKKVNESEKRWEEERARVARVQEAQLTELQDVVRHRCVAEMMWEREHVRLMEARATAEAHNERLVQAQERQAVALERIAKAAEQGK